MRKYRSVRTVALISALALTLSGCATETTETTGTAETANLLESHGLGDMDAVEMIDHLDRLPVAERPANMIASVRHDELLLSVPSSTDEQALPLPAGQTYLSIAPYATQTHDCFYHSLTTCLGELGNTEVEVSIRDKSTGEILIDERATTFDNGFIGFWLPTGAAGTIEITHEGQTGSTEFSTAADGATCVTTLQVV